MDELSLVQDAQVAEFTLLPLFGNRKEIVAVRPERITERSLVRIHYEIVAVRISDLVAQRLQISDGNRFSTIKRRQIDNKTVGRKVTAEPPLEQRKEFQHLFPCAADDKMNVIVHQFKCNDPDTRAIIGAHRYKRHRIDEILPVIENDGLLFTRRAKMPHAPKLLQSPFENPPAPFLLLEIRMFLSHNLFHKNLQRHRGYGQDKVNTRPPDLQESIELIATESKSGEFTEKDGGRNTPLDYDNVIGLFNRSHISRVWSIGRIHLSKVFQNPDSVDAKAAPSFIHCFPDESMKNLVDCSYNDIKESLQQYVMTQTTERLHLAKRIRRYDKNSKRIDENYWTQDFNRKPVAIPRREK